MLRILEILPTMPSHIKLSKKTNSIKQLRNNKRNLIVTKYHSEPLINFQRYSELAFFFFFINHTQLI